MAGGRKPGSPNKRNSLVQDTLARLHCDPIEGMVEVANYAVNKMRDQTLTGDVRDEAARIAGGMFKEISKYYAPQLKATEIRAEVITGEDLMNMLPKITGLSPEEDEEEFKQEQEKEDEEGKE